MKRLIITFSFLILLSYILGCDSITDTEYDNQLNICSMLRADSTDFHLFQEVMVDQTYKMNEQSQPWIDDAIVILSSKAQQDTLYYFYNSIYYTSCNFNPRDTMSIMVIKQGLDTLQGSTIIPGPISVIHPTIDDTVSFSDSLILKICENGALYRGSGGRTDTTWNSLSAYYLPEKGDTLIKVPLRGFGEYLGAGNYYFRFVVFDSNYYNYFIDNDSIVSSGVTGGIGLFGSSYMTEIYFELVE